MSGSRVMQAAMVVGLMLVLSACAAGPNEAVDAGADPAGFWLGLWHGFITPVTFVVSLFTDNVNVYEVNNSGNWYDFGFVIGVSVIFSGAGGGSHSAATSKTRSGRRP